VDESPDPVDVSTHQQSRPWSAGQTLALAAAVGALLPLVNMGVAMLLAGYLAAGDATFNQQLFYQQLGLSGQYLTFATLATNGAIIWAVLKLIQLRRTVGWPIYLALRMPAGSAWLTTLAGLVLLLTTSQIVGALFQRPQYPEFLLQVYVTANPLFLFWIAVVLVAPVAEEVYFRGFVFVGLRNSALGASGAIVVTAVIWSLIHLQYDVYDKVEIFLLGLFFGWLRFRYNSLLPPILAHCLVNLTALVGLASTVA